ncbi:xanthine phosphoribosyltransferase [Athalassotoga saccharophila]|uniref:xanthine phosphoribosyltransferase n=1 Tax=Athalassotoga saccharophila TaxID=1441386 RepID=UPI00137A6386|nr:xanthine phosphoribosyltransferase [Athalassotoga saccharophila]BBJ27336.1 xanthine phosphoribosyltransferase [Athalassotoga saccharophila]
MDLLKEKILKDGRVVGEDILKVDSFLNHQIDIKLMNEIGKEFRKRFKDEKVTKILTVESSGISVACITSQYFDYVPVIFAKKHEAFNLDLETYEADVFSFTKNRPYRIRVSKRFLSCEDSVLIIDDFLANGSASLGLVKIVKDAGGRVAGVGIVIEKAFQNGRKVLEKENVRVESLAIIKSMKNGEVIFD